MDFYFLKSFSFHLSLKTVVPLPSFFYSSLLVLLSPPDTNWHFGTFIKLFTGGKL
jgi:hypothetical protein